MNFKIRPAVTAIGIACLATVAGTAAFAQAPKQPTAAQAAPPAAPTAAPAQDAPPPKQMALTDKQIDQVLAAQKDLDAITDKLPEQAPDKPDPKVITQLDGVAKKNGFASYAEYNDVVGNIMLVLSGFDPQAKKYVGPEAIFKQQIAAVQADKKMPAKDKQAALADLNAALKAPPPAIENKGNIDLVAKYYDKLAAAMQGDD
ncbi:MAG: hypothetical protein ABWY18_15585 [Tardiphaga sp.]